LVAVAEGAAMRPVGKVSVILPVPATVSSVDVVKDTVKVAAVLTAWVIFNAVFASAVTPPTIGVSTQATRVVDVEVSILRPVVPGVVAARSAAFAVVIIPVHVTVTPPAGRVEVRISSNTLDVDKGVVAVIDEGEVMPQ